MATPPITHHSTSLRIGLLGGSFNPAHAGHLHVSEQALRRLKLDQVWWLVSSQNPLKQAGDYADYAARVAQARHVTRHHPAIHIKTLERDHQFFYSVDTVRFLRKRWPKTRFVWLMGADNLEIMHRWRLWREIFCTLPIAVFDRAPFSHTSLHSRAALSFRGCAVPQTLVASLPDRPAPAWSYIFMSRHPESATRLRNLLGEKAFLRHNETD